MEVKLIGVSGRDESDIDDKGGGFCHDEKFEKWGESEIDQIYGIFHNAQDRFQCSYRKDQDDNNKNQ